MKFAVVFALLPLVAAIKLPIQRRLGPRANNSTPQNISTGENLFYLSNYQNVFYSTNITIGGVELPVNVDTGSADLWVFLNVPLAGTRPSDVPGNVNLSYGLGSVSGPVVYTPFSLGSYSVASQVFVNATSVLNMTALAQSGAQGIMGISFDTTGTSPINTVLQGRNATSLVPNPQGRSPVTNIFLQNPSMRSMFDVLLGREQDVEGVSGGILALGEHVPGYEDVESMPQLPRVLAQGQEDIPRWNIPLTAVSVNNEIVPLNFSQPGAPPGQGIAFMDTGNSVALVPRSLVDKLYSQIEGAYFSAANQAWGVPCATPVANVSFFFGGIEYPVHPLDLTSIIDGRPSGLNSTICMSTFVDIGTQLRPGLDGFDVWLGDAFLRNVYASGRRCKFNYGDGGVDGGNPFMQLLPLTNQHQAYADFQLSRRQVLIGLPPELPKDEAEQIMGQMANITTSPASPPSSTSGGSAEAQDLAADASSSDGEKDEVDQKLLDRLNTYGPAVIGLLAGMMLIGLVLCGVALAMYVRGGAKRSAGSRVRNVSPGYAPVRLREVEAVAVGQAGQGGGQPEDEPFVVPVLKYQ